MLICKSLGPSFNLKLAVSYLATIISTGNQFRAIAGLKYHHGPTNNLKRRNNFGSTQTVAKMNEFLAKNDDSDNDSSRDPHRGRPGIVVFSGGTAFNSAAADMASRITNGLDVAETGITDARDKVDDNEVISRDNRLADIVTFASLSTYEQKIPMGIAGGTKVWHVLPVTDDGGSTAEIVRVLGGPAVGDIRSRLLRLAPGTTNEARAVRRLLGHRLVSMERGKHPGEEATRKRISKMAREEWLDILEGGHDGKEHSLWKEVSTPYRSIIRSFLVHFHSQVLQTSQSSPPFDFTGGSVGNFFFAGARTFFGSLPATIFLFSKVAEIPTGSRVLPAVLTEERLVLGAELKNKVRIRGQYNISHPKPKINTSLDNESSGHRPVVKSGSFDSKEDILSLHPSPISRITYLLRDPTWQRKNQLQSKLTAKSNASDWNDRHEIYPEPNPLVIEALSNANCIVYGCGSLFTSVIPSLVLSGVGKAIAECDGIVPRIMLLNGWHDRETSWVELEKNVLVVKKMDATACVKAVVDALDQGGKVSDDDNDEITPSKSFPLVTDYISHILFPIGTEIEINEQSLREFCQKRANLIERHTQESPQADTSREIESIKLIGVQSMPANTCPEGIRSGGKTNHRIFHTPSLVDTILDLANGGNRLLSSL